MASEGRSITDLIGGLAGEVSTLFRKEVQLAKAEATEKMGEMLEGVVVLVAGGVLALGALGVLLGAAVTALKALFQAWGMGQTGANSLAALIVGIIVAAIAWMLVQRGLNRLRAANLMMNKTTNSLARDAAVVKESL